MGEPAKLLLTGSMSSEEVEIWKTDFVWTCLDMFGAPTSAESCLSKDEAYYFSYCTVCLAVAMKEHSFFWLQDIVDGTSPEDAAYAFAEYYEQEHGDTLVPLYKAASPHYDIDGEY